MCSHTYLTSKAKARITTINNQINDYYLLIKDEVRSMAGFAQQH
ncbi:MAG: hypothetical protein ACJAXW_003510 [Candidatus Azotimanducaceae bacterium]|jgi:hypothetical protein